MTIHDLAFERYPEDFSRRTGWKYRTFTPRAARSAERVICVSQHTRDDVCERYGVDPANARAWCSPARTPAARRRAAARGPYVLAVGDLRGKKNLLRLVEAFRAAARARACRTGWCWPASTLGGGERIRAAAGDAPVELPGFVPDGASTR